MKPPTPKHRAEARLKRKIFECPKDTCVQYIDMVVYACKNCIKRVGYPIDKASAALLTLVDKVPTPRTKKKTK